MLKVAEHLIHNGRIVTDSRPLVNCFTKIGPGRDPRESRPGEKSK